MDEINERWLQEVEDGIEVPLRTFEEIVASARKHLGLAQAWADACRTRAYVLGLDRTAKKQFEIVAHRIETRCKKLQRKISDPLTAAELREALAELDKMVI